MRASFSEAGLRLRLGVFRRCVRLRVDPLRRLQRRPVGQAIQDGAVRKARKARVQPAQGVAGPQVALQAMPEGLRQLPASLVPLRSYNVTGIDNVRALLRTEQPEWLGAPHVEAGAPEMAADAAE